MAYKVINSHFPHILQQKTEHRFVIMCVVCQDYIAMHRAFIVDSQIFGRKYPVVVANKNIVVLVVVFVVVFLKLIFIFFDSGLSGIGFYSVFAWRKLYGKSHGS